MNARDYIQYKDFYFSVADYCVFAAMILLSTGTGIYFGFFKRQKVPLSDAYQGDGDVDGSGAKVRKTNDFGSSKMNEYLLGSRRMKTFPVAMSLIASYVSGVTILGTASEIYNYGTQYWLIVVAIIFMGIAVSRIYLPVFTTQRVGSSYEYLEMRFNSTIRSIASFMFVMDEIFFLPIIVYVPSIAFNQVTGINVHIISGVMCVICVFYTLIGGIKAVVHTDAWQTLVMFMSVVLVVILGSIFVGGPKQVFEHAAEGGRLIFLNINPSPFDRQTLWAVLIGGFFYWTSFNSVNQTMVQRYMSLPSLKKARQSIAIFIVGIVLFVSVCCYSGLLIYDFYRNCDPLTAGLIQNDDQLLPLYVMQTVGHLKGIPGLFIAGVFGAALSSLSVVLNSTALVLLEDIVKGCFKCKLSERASSVLVKSSVIVLGCVALSLVFVLEHLDGILSVATSVTAIAAGTTFGIFTLGMLIPWSNSKGALFGAIAGACMSGWISFGSQAMLATGRVVPPKLEMSVSECMPNMTIPDTGIRDESDVFPLYRLSFHWINPIGVGTTVLVGVIVSFLTGPTKLTKLDGDLISPIIHRFLPKECFPPPCVDIDINGERIRDNTTHLLGESATNGNAKGDTNPSCSEASERLDQREKY